MKPQTLNGQTDDILQSMDGAARAIPREGLLPLIEQRIALPFTKGKTISLGTLSAAAASVALLVCMNMAMLWKQNTPVPSKGGDPATQVVEYYGIMNNGEMLGI
ncbi:hypothetical protein CAP35_10515 [Chitinophagaceae bacterium IBVUCB1]|nr:hypothetical protein CAP35_10515 [Chitinophagaceae bacterium IBVUCB1]